MALLFNDGDTTPRNPSFPLPASGDLSPPTVRSMTRPLSLAAALVPVVLVAALVLGAGLNNYPAWEPWHLAAAMLDPGYLRELYVSQHWERVVDAGHSMHARPALFYVPVLLALLAEHALVFAVTSPEHVPQLVASGPFVPWRVGPRRALYASQPPPPNLDSFDGPTS